MHTTSTFVLGCALGLSLGYVLTPRAECCAMFDVPFNTQLEIEREQQWRDSLAPFPPAGSLYQSPILPCGNR